MNAHDASELAFKNGYAAGFKAAEEHYQLEIKALQAANKGMYTASCEMDAQITKLTAERDESRREWRAEADSVTQLLRVISEIKAERDCAVAAIKKDFGCSSCKWQELNEEVEPCNGCHSDRLENWEWGGVKEEREK